MYAARLKNSPREGRSSYSAVEIKQIHIFSTPKQILHHQWGPFFIHTNYLLLFLMHMELSDNHSFGVSLDK